MIRSSKKLPLLYLLTAISFLLIYHHGDKISVFNFIAIPFYLLAIIEGQLGILGLNMPIFLQIATDIIIVGALIWSVYYLMSKGINERLNSKTFPIISLLIMIAFSLFMLFRPNLAVSTLITTIIFLSFAAISFVATISLNKN
ncbi:MAG: hypothetical protein REI64_08060 [Pedobacter sp.]|uniref:hypothetical protein n=1 Tax=Pedobacter sp. TaxID=1411316 RepID=UPI0028092967|nr:hypothetical protein [Pedobacter sp.]MDQ8004736.1 hypothetical protein [Pedobacter sp.]